MVQQIRIAKTGQVEVALLGLFSGDALQDFSATGVVIKSGGATANLYFADACVLPADFIVKGESRLKTVDEIKQYAQEILADISKIADEQAKELARATLKKYEAGKVRLQDALGHRTITISQDAAIDETFFGVRTVAGAAVGATVRIAADLLLDGQAPRDGIVLHVLGCFTVNAGAGGQPVAAALALSVQVTVQGIVKMLPSFDIPQIAFNGLPKLDLGWVEALDFGGLDFSGLSADSFSKLLGFVLPSLSGPGGPAPFALHWAPTTPKVTFSVTAGELTAATDAPANGAVVMKVAGEPKVAELTNFSFSLQGGALTLHGVLTFNAPTQPQPIDFDFDNLAFPLTIHSIDAQANLAITMTGGYDLGTGTVTAPLTISAKLSWPKLQISARADPRIFLTLNVGYDVMSNLSDGSVTGRLSRLSVVDPYPLQLVTAAGQTAIDGVVRLFGMLDVGVNDPSVLAVIKRLGEFAAVIADWVAEGAAAVGSALIDVGEFLISAASKIFDALKAMANAAGKYVVLKIQLDASTWAIRQIRVSFEGASGDALMLDEVGLTLKVPGGWRPALLIDLSENRPLFALVACPATASETITLSTDLWYSRPNAPSEPVRDSNKDTGASPSNPLIVIEGTLNTSIKALALVAYDAGKMSFFNKIVEVPAQETLVLDSGRNISIAAFTRRPVLSDLTFGRDGAADLALDVTLAPDAKERLLPFLSGPPPQGSPATGGGSPGGGLINSLGQYIKVGEDRPSITVHGGAIELDLPIEVAVGSLRTQSTIQFSIDIRTLKATISGDSTVVIKGPQVASAKLLGLDAAILPVQKLATPDTPFAQFVLDFSHGGARLALMKESARLELSFRRIASGGRGLVFIIDDFAIGKGGLDLEAKADADVPVTLAGVEVPFRFTEGGVSIRSSRLNSFNITGKGQLPPALIGEANLTASLAMGMQDGNLTFKSASVVLDKGAAPIVSRTTRFSASLQKVELDAFDFGNDGIHFWFLITGSARFTRGSGEFSDGLLKNLGDLEIVFDQAPLTTNISVLKRRLRNFKIAVRLKKQINFFNLFKFELRSFGYHPEVERFGNTPAVSISGQINFADTGDTVSPKIDFHDLWIAPPKPGMALPQIAFDGLGVEMKLGGVKVEATAMTVDGAMPTLALDPAIHYPDGITMEGFLASGRLIVDGWAPIAGAMGFLELSNGDSRKHSFFVYGQAEQLSIPIPTPIGDLYLREVGFGLGYRYTFAGLVAADQVKSPEQLIQVLDDVSKRQGELASFKAWAPEIEGDRLTLAMRALFTVESATDENELTEEERDIANPFMFDVAAALRSDLTFLMTVRVWLNTNYYSWVYGKLDDETDAIKTPKEQIHSAPPLRGYLYLSAPRKTFLGRMLADGTGYLGEDPPLNSVLKTAMQGVRWSATMLIQPGLFHFELGWPYELEIKFQDKTSISDMAIDMQGGMVFRIEDTSMLYGVAFRGSGYAQIGGRIGSDSFGASAIARADFKIDGKFIAYIPVSNPKNTLFYGAISFASTLAIAIAVWLRIKIFGGTIGFSVDLSFSQTLTLALELAASPDDLGGRGAASLSFSAFGRTARVGASFAFNEGKLEEARQQVQRFLSIGLGVVTPDPAKGLQPPPATAAPAQASKDVDAAVEERHDLVKALMAVPTEMIGQPCFWAVLFEIPAVRQAQSGRRDFVMQFIPRDHTTGLALQNEDPRTTFFAPPAPAGADPFLPTAAVVVDYRIDGLLTPLNQIKPNNVQPAGAAYSADQNATVALVDNTTGNSAGNTFKLYHLLHECFLAVTEVGGFYVRRDDDHLFDGDLREPLAIPIDATPKRLSADSAQATETLRDASRRQVPLEPAPAANQGPPALPDYAREVEERRSNIISAIAESAAALAAYAVPVDGVDDYRWPDRRTGIDARDFGLTFRVSQDDIDRLFADQGDELPPKSAFTIKARTSKFASEPDPGTGNPVRLLNPLKRFFATQNPALAGAIARLTKDGIALDWDLEPPWSASTGPYNDPEFLTRYYLVRREVIGENGTDRRFPPVEFQVKASAPERRMQSGHDARIERLRHLAHFVDSLGDIAAYDATNGTGLADALLHRGANPFAAWSAIDAGDHPRILLYTVTPVDLAGSRGEPTPIVYEVEAPRETIRPLTKAEMIFRYNTMPTQTAGALSDLALFLRIDDPCARDKDHQDEPALPQDDTRFTIRFRREIAVPGGLFGVDSLSQARARPTPGDFDQPLRRGDIDITVAIKLRETVLADDPDGVGRPFTTAERFQPLQIAPGPTDWNPIRGKAYFEVVEGSLDDVKRLITGVASDLAGYRVAVQRVAAKAPADSPTASPGIVASPWCPADLALLIHTDQTTKTIEALPVETMVEVFEHPRSLSFNALGFEDLDGNAGRLELYHPEPAAALGDLIDVLASEKASLPPTAPRPMPQRAAPIRRLVDPDRRTATRVRWNSRPASSTAFGDSVNPTEFHKLIGGFDVFETDLAELARLHDLRNYARRVARVQRLPDDQFGLDPGEIADFGKVEAHYPSEALRYKAGGELGRQDEQAAWFSTAETLLLWPRPVLRRFVLPTPPDPDLMPLFERGKPDQIQVRLTLPVVTREDGSVFSGRVMLVGPSDPVHNFVPLAPPPYAVPSEASKQPPYWMKSANDIWTPSEAYLSEKDKNEPPYWVFGNTTGGWKPSELTDFLRNLRWEPIDGHDRSAADDAYAENPSMFSAVRVSIRAMLHNEFVAEVSFATNLNPSLHPFLADVIERLRFDASNGPLHRRYTPVLDGAPPTKVKTLADFMNERPADRDPHGWALLRTLGLAAGIKLFDLERGDYVPARDALPRINAAFSEVSVVYLQDAAAGMLGQPFVEVMASADGLHMLSSFDSGVPATTTQDVTHLIGEKGLSLVQIALRPVAEALAAEAVFAGYACVYCTGGTKKIPLPIPGPGVTALLDCIDISGGLSGGQPVQVGAGDPAAIAVLGGRPLPQVFEVGNAISGPVALIRVTVAGTANAASFIKGWVDATKGDTQFCVKALLTPAAAQLLDPSGVEMPGASPEPFGRFAPLSGTVLDALLFGADAIIPKHAQAENSLLRFVSLANRKGLSEVLPAPSTEHADLLAARRARLAELHAFTARFMAHGPARAMASDEVPFALATVVRHDPWRIAPTADGIMDTLFIHDDSWGRRRRYVVRPFGRYENLASAVASGAEVPGAKDARVGKAVPNPNLHDIADGSETFADRSVDITVPRTHALLAPTFLSSRRLDVIDMSAVTPEAGRRAGRKIEFVLARHPEEILSEGNRQVADGYQFDGLGLQFFREYASPAWARGLTDNASIGIVDSAELVPMLGRPMRPDPLPISFDNPSFAETRHAEDGAGGLTHGYDAALPERIVDGWRGILAVRTADIPYFYHTHAVAHAAAGVIVSDAVAATVPEGRAIPRLPWGRPPWEVRGAPRSVATRAPYWSVQVDETGTVITLIVSLPLLRHIDAISNEDQAQWLTDIALPKVFRLPDANALYSIALEAGSAATGARVVEADLMPLVPDDQIAPARRKSSYLVVATGTRFKAPNSLFIDAAGKPARLEPTWEHSPSIVPPTADGGGLWKADLPLVRQYKAPDKDTPTGAVEPILPDAARAALATLEIAAAPTPPLGWQLWAGMAKPVTTTFAATRPPGVKPADWAAFRNAVAPLRDQYLQLVPNSPALSFLQRMLDCANAANPDVIWRSFAGAGRTYSEDVRGWVPGLPRAIGASAACIAIVPPTAATPGWGLSISEDQSAIRMRIDVVDLILASTGPTDDARQSLADTLWRIMSGLVIGRLARQSVPSHGYDTASRALVGSGLGPIGGVVDHAGLPKVFEMTRAFELGTFKSPDLEKLVILLEAIEGQPARKADGLDPRQGIERAFVALNAVAGKRGDGDTVTLMIGQNAFDHYGTLLTDYLATVQPPAVPTVKAPDTLTLRRPPSDDELSTLAALPGVDDTAIQVVRALAQEQMLGVGRRMTVRITRGFAIPVSDAIERLPT